MPLQFAPANVHVYPASACNLACPHCWNRGGSFGRRERLMSAETARATVAYLRSLAESTPEAAFSVTLFGGEPLVNEPVTLELLRALAAARTEIGKDIRVLLFTNGTLVDDDLMEVLTGKPFIECHVAIDGPELIHDSHRRDRLDRGTFSVVATNVRKLVARGVCVVAETIVYPPYDYAGLLELYEGLGVRYAYLQEEILPIHGAPSAIGRWAGVELLAWGVEYRKLVVEYVRRIANGTAMLLDPLFGVAKTFIPKPDPEPVACTAGTHQICIDVEGDLYACNLLQGNRRFRLGSVRSGPDMEAIAAVHRLLDGEGRIVDHVERCRTCWIRLKCRGGCFYRNLIATGSIDGLEPEAVCEFRRLKALIEWEFVEAMRARFPSYESDVLTGNYRPYFPDLYKDGMVRDGAAGERLT